MQRNRIGSGLAIAMFVVALAAIPAGLPAATLVLAIVAVLIALGTFAPMIPGVRRLPVIGARRAELTVVFNPTAHPACVQDRRDHPTQPDFMLRLCAVNTGDVVLTGVRSRLKGPHHDHFGRVRYDDVEPFDLSRNGITLQPGACDFFDVAFCHFRAPQMVLQYASTYLMNEQAINVTFLKTVRTCVEISFEARREDTDEWIPAIVRRYLVAPNGDAITLIEVESQSGGEGQRPLGGEPASELRENREL